MGIDLNDLPDHVQKQIKDANKGIDATKKATGLVKAKAVPHDNNMNKTEKNYSEYLEVLKINGEILDWKHEPFNLRLAKRTFYKPDFVVITLNGYIEIHEVKGRWEDDALVKIKVAAKDFPWFTFKAVFNEKGGWRYRRFDTRTEGFVYEQKP
jgi:hypothetical protein